MSDTVHLQVITPLKLVLSEDVDEVVAPGEIGEFGVLPGHTPFVTTLFPGELKFKKGSEQKVLIIHGGLAEVNEDNVKVLTDLAEEPGAIDRVAAQKDLESIEDELKQKQRSEEELQELNWKLKLAQVRASAK